MPKDSVFELVPVELVPVELVPESKNDLLDTIANNVTDFDRKILAFAKVRPLRPLYSVWTCRPSSLDALTASEQKLTFNKSFICNLADFYRKNMSEQVEIILGLLLRSMVTNIAVVRFTDKLRFLSAIQFMNSDGIVEHFGNLQYQVKQGNVETFTSAGSYNCKEFALLIFKKLEGNFVTQGSTDFPDPLFIAQLYELHFLFSAISTKQKYVGLKNIRGLQSYLIDVIGIPKKKITEKDFILQIDL